jgi:hypothetical protein
MPDAHVGEQAQPIVKQESPSRFTIGGISDGKGRDLAIWIKLNGALTTFIAKLRPDLDSWDLRCIDPLVGEFRLRPGDTLHFWSEQFREWLPGREMDLIEMAVAELERGPRDASKQTATQSGSQVRQGSRPNWLTTAPVWEKGCCRSAFLGTEMLDAPLLWTRSGVPTHISW